MKYMYVIVKTELASYSNWNLSWLNITNNNNNNNNNKKKTKKKQFEHNGYVNEYDELSIQSYVFANMIPTHGIS